MALHADALEQLARTDPSVAPLARLQAVALEAAEQPTWAEGISPFTFHTDGTPLLHGQTLGVDTSAQRGLLVQLAKVLSQAGVADGQRLSKLFGDRAYDPLSLLTGSITDNRAMLETTALQAEVAVASLAVIAHVAALPVLLAVGRQAVEAVQEIAWTHGYCAVCSAYPLLAELRGLARDRVLRCGRCASGWSFEHDRCPFCDTQDQQVQGYFAAESERESRRAVTCDACRGYLKTVATLGPLSPAQLLLRDLETLELDVTVLEHEYQRPTGLGWPLQVAVQAAPERRSGWRMGWRR